MNSSNEELALEVQRGTAGALEQLSRQNAGMLHRTAYRLYVTQGGPDNTYGMELADCEQFAFLGLYGAAMAYDTAKGYKLLSYLWRQTLRVLHRFYGRGSADALSRARSLDEPLQGEHEGMALLDAVPDESAAAALEEVDQKLWAEQAGIDITAALEDLPSTQREVLRTLLFEGSTRHNAARALGLRASHVQSLERSALASLRRCRRLRQYRKEFISSRAYRATGLTAWRERGGSHMELLLEDLEARGFMQRLEPNQEPERMS